MYEWLADALQESSQVVTASQRLARTLADDYARQQVAAGRTAWRSPPIAAWHHWLSNLLSEVGLTQPVPTQINAHQSKVLWERCLHRELSDPLLNMSLLVRQTREAWARLQASGVPLEEVAQSARGRDQHIFARAAAAYDALLREQKWIDEGGVATELLRLIRDRALTLPARLTIAGFDRIPPQVRAILDALDAAGVSVNEAPTEAAQAPLALHRYENPDAELRAAGAWARNRLQEDSRQSVAIVVTGLERDAERCGRLIREGFAPGWQFADRSVEASVNVSYGRKLAAYPAIAIALLELRCLR